MIDFSKWWSSLTVTQKERIASKIEKRQVYYPECSSVWEALSDEKKQKIHDHCVDSHGYLLKDWLEGKPYGD